MQFTNQKNALHELPEDPRDFPLGAVFGEINVTEVPSIDFVVATPSRIKDQGDTDFCSAYAVTEVSEDQEGIELLPEYQFYVTKKITGNKEQWGADLRSACQSATKYGSVAVGDFPDMQGKPRDFILDAKNWASSAGSLAGLHKKETYFTVTGNHDTFDNIRCALWQHRADKSSVVTGIIFRREWLNAPNGVVTDTQGEGIGHAFKIFGQKIINAEVYLVAQLSQGENVGDKGLFYFNRTIINRELGKFGIFMFKDISREEAEHYIAAPYNKNTPIIQKLFLFISNLFKKNV